MRVNTRGHGYKLSGLRPIDVDVMLEIYFANNMFLSNYIFCVKLG